MPSPVIARARRLAIGLGGAAAIALCSAPAASADFSVGPCQPEGIFGRGASFANGAIGGFAAVFRTDANGCGANGPTVSYDPAGSGAGRRSLGERSGTNALLGDRDPTVRFGATDEPPTPAQRQQIEQGPIDSNSVDVTAADDGKLHVIPIAIGAITVMVHLPNNCDYSGTDRFENRPKITNETLEKVFSGEITTWGAAITGLDATCAAAPITRVVRQDSSGTTFAFKQLLHNIDPQQGWAGLPNQEWPSNSTVLRGDSAGNGPLRDKLIATAGGIGYADLATARGGNGQPFTWADATDTMFWIPLQRRATVTYDDPQDAQDGYQTAVSTGTNPPRGANCADATVSNVPSDSFGNWFPVDSTYSTTGYNGCTLTYIMAFDDNSTVYCNSAAEERKARTLKDFLSRSVVSAAGQASLETTDYDQMPAAILATAQAAVAQISWKKTSGGRPCSAPPITNPGGGGGGGGGGGTTPPPPAVSNVFSIANARSTSSSVRINMEFPGAGKLVVTGSCKASGLKAIKLSSKTVTIDGAGSERVTVALNSKAKKALKRKRKLSVTLKLTYTPTGGTAKTVTRKVTVKSSRR